MFKLNRDVWVEEPSSRVDARFNTVSIDLANFSIYAIMGISSVAQRLNNIIAYPNPCKQYPRITFANLTDQCRIRIYNIARELVFEQEYTNGKVEWDIKNKEGKLLHQVSISMLSQTSITRKTKQLERLG